MVRRNVFHIRTVLYVIMNVVLIVKSYDKLNKNVNQKCNGSNPNCYGMKKRTMFLTQLVKTSKQIYNLRNANSHILTLIRKNI